MLSNCRFANPSSVHLSASCMECRCSSLSLSFSYLSIQLVMFRICACWQIPPCYAFSGSGSTVYFWNAIVHLPKIVELFASSFWTVRSKSMMLSMSTRMSIRSLKRWITFYTCVYLPHCLFLDDSHTCLCFNF